ncbi:MAG TPA: HEAT repeat domain-containing protein [Candidatus Acidoferrum sp.]|nr:HEAT repeat domain-containing protein [Candidatus Acidoferrum sp.]
MQEATRSSVRGDFARGKIVLHGETYALSFRDGQFYISESDLTGSPWEHRVEYTLGEKRYQQYLVTLPDGRIVALPSAWDILQKRWVYDLDMASPEVGTTNPLPVWNKSCAECHASGVQKNFDLEKMAYRTAWRSLGVDCESCHGPGAEHVAIATAAKKQIDPKKREEIRAAIVNPAKMDAQKSTMICAQCHALRDTLASGFRPGDDFNNFYVPVMEYRLPGTRDGAYWADGRPRQISNEAIGLWQSGCYLKGKLTCVTCHTRLHARESEADAVDASANAQCVKCHSQIAEHLTAHTHHPAKSAGSSCIECHMPRTIAGLHGQMRDHSMSIPTPENTLSHLIPNACNACHRDKDANWAAKTMDGWYGKDGREKEIRRADTFAAAKQGDAAAIPGLLEILADDSNGAFLRANAAGYLGNFSNDPSAYEALLKAFGDSNPLVRETAATAIRASAAQREELAGRLATLLGDPIRSVRMNAGIAMVAMGVRPFPGEVGQQFEDAKKLYHERADLNSDDAQQQLAAGKFSFLSGDMQGAVAAFRATIKLDSSIPAQYYLARSLAEEGEYDEARNVLDAISRDDPQYGAAQRLLAEIAEKAIAKSGAEAEANSGAKEEHKDAEAKFLSGQLSYENQMYGAALKDLDDALQQAPQAEWAEKAEAYRAISLEKLGRTNEAENALKSLTAREDAKQNVELQLAYVELLNETGRAGDALQRVEELIAAVPTAPKAYFWRAKLLLQMGKGEEAAKAGEKAVELLPDFPEAHNLLLKIYQTLGRSKEAAQQAEWLRNYQRRTGSH